MEIFIGSLVIFLLSALALMLGQFFGRAPISGSCSSTGHCAHADACKLDCTFRQVRRRSGETR
jgi:hypothetical protein